MPKDSFSWLFYNLAEGKNKTTSPLKGKGNKKSKHIVLVKTIKNSHVISVNGIKIQFRKLYHLCEFPSSLFQCWWFQWQPHSCWFCWWILRLLCGPGVLSNLCNQVTGEGDTIPPKSGLRRSTLFPKHTDSQHRRHHPSYITVLDVKLIKLYPPFWTCPSWSFSCAQQICIQTHRCLFLVMLLVNANRAITLCSAPFIT